MERAEMEARAGELGIKYRSNTPDDALAKRIAEAEAVPERIKAKVLWGQRLVQRDEAHEGRSLWLHR